MKFQITDGLDLLAIGLCDTGNYLRYKKTLSATQPISAIDQDRVKYFEGEIKQGKHPFVIVFNCAQKDLDYNETQSDHFVLDGHHKLIAYQNLNIYPAIVEITHLPTSKADLEFDLDQLSEVLYPWQFEHIKRHS